MPTFLRLTVVELSRFRGGYFITALPLDKLSFNLTKPLLLYFMFLLRVFFLLLWLDDEHLIKLRLMSPHHVRLLA
jgi:hypothetical protein